MRGAYLSYKLNKELFAVQVEQVLKILQMEALTPVPKSPPHMKGLLNLRGSIIPVVDLRLKLGFEEIQHTRDTCILVLELLIQDDKLVLGCIVDEVMQVLEIDAEQIQPSPSIGEKYESELIKGMYLHGENFIIILDYSQIFSSDESINLSANSETKKS